MGIDCKLMVDTIHYIRFDLLEFGYLITECKNLVSRGHNLSIWFVKRQANNDLVWWRALCVKIRGLKPF